MKRLVSTCGVLLVAMTVAWAQTPAGPAGQPSASGQGRGRGQQSPPRDPPAAFFSRNEPGGLVDFELMTWPEVYRAIHKEGKTTAILPFGGTESRGPQNVNGGHNLMGRAIAREIALKLGNALVLPLVPYSVNNASNQTTGTLGLTNEIQAAICEQIAEQAIATGFATVIIVNDHGGGTSVYGEVARKLETKYRAPGLASRNIHVFYADRVYRAAQDDFDKWLEAHHLPVSSHAGIPDTSTMMYLQQQDKKPNAYTRLDLLPVAVTVQNPADPKAPQPVPSGVSGDGRQSDPKYGRMAMDMKVDYAVQQIQALLKSVGAK